MTDTNTADWRAELKAQGRTLRWLAVQTGKSPRTVYAYSQGQLKAPAAWLDAAWRVMGKGTSDEGMR